MDTTAQLKEIFARQYGRSPALLIYAPGRVSLLGAHVDYNEGWVLPAAIDRGVWLLAAPTDDQLVTIEALNFDESGQFRLPYLEVQASSVLGNWLNYPLGVAWTLQERGLTLSGMDVLLASDLPMGAGLSSSAAVEMAFVLAWEALGGFVLTGLEKAQVGRRTENDYVGVNSGIMDQFVSIHGRSHHFVYLDCRTLEHELVPLPAEPETAVLIADSGVRRRLVHNGYNNRPAECAEAVRLLQPHLPHVRALRDVTADELMIHGHLLPDHLRRRVQHVVGEIDRVHAGVEALRRGDLRRFGRLMRESQVSSRDNYENSLPELDVLAAAAWGVPGCLGARFSGGGGGGMMQVLVEKTAVSAVQTAMQQAFIESFGREPAFFDATISDGARVVWSDL